MKDRVQWGEASGKRRKEEEEMSGRSQEAQTQVVMSVGLEGSWGLVWPLLLLLLL